MCNSSRWIAPWNISPAAPPNSGDLLLPPPCPASFMKCHIGERRSAPQIALGLVVIMLALLKDAVVAGNLAKANGEILVPMTNLVRYELHGLLNELGESKLLCMPNY